MFGRLEPGTVVGGDFRIIGLVGEGGMATVYRVEQLSTGAVRALKVMHPQLVGLANFRRRFEQEARIGAQIASDYIARVVSAGLDEADGLAWLAMEMLEGQVLDAHISRHGPLSMDLLLVLFAQLTDAVGKAHDLGIVHRDLKPENVFLALPQRAGEPFTVKVLDFGIAKLTSDCRATATATIGSPLWMAPEQAQRGASIGPQADTWALGLVAFYCLTGVSYWFAAQDQAGTVTELLRELTLDPLESASQRAQRLHRGDCIPASFDPWFARCVHRRVEERFADARVAYLALQQTLVSTPSSVRLPFGGMAPSYGASPLLDAPKPPLLRRLHLRLAMAALLAVGVSLVGVRVLRCSTTSAPPLAAVSASAQGAADAPSSLQPCSLPAKIADGLQAMNDGAFFRARASFEGALRDDPRCAVAHLRLLLLTVRDDPTNARSYYVQAFANRSQFDEAHRALLDALEPAVRAVPAYEEWERRLVAVTEKFPHLLEAFAQLATVRNYRGEYDDALLSSQRALSVDPSFAPALRVRARTERRLGEVATAVATLSECLRRSPIADACLAERMDIRALEGPCDAYEADGAALAALTPENAGAWYAVASALAQRQGPREAIQDAFDQASKAPGLAPFQALHARSSLAVFEGDFDTAARVLREQMKLAGEREATTRLSPALRLAVLYGEMKRPADAAAIAEEVFHHADLWETHHARRIIGDPTVVLLPVLADAGRITQAELSSRRDRWLARQGADIALRGPDAAGRFRGYLWIYAYAALAVDAASARLALDKLADYEPLAPSSMRSPFDDLCIGQVYVRAGRPELGIPHLQRATGTCNPLDFAFLLPRASLLLGLAFEATGDRTRARQAYERVLGFWGKASYSMTVQQARARISTLEHAGKVFQ
ncbi:MAG: protein kinase [Myxococcales bacterium]